VTSKPLYVVVEVKIKIKSIGGGKDHSQISLIEKFNLLHLRKSTNPHPILKEMPLNSCFESTP
jgi:hypothetical protein